MYRFLRVLMLSALFAGGHITFSFGESPAFYFTMVPDRDVSALVERFSKLTAYLQSKLGVKVIYVPVTSYEQAVEEFAAGQVQLGWFGAYSGLKARHAVPGSSVIAQGALDQEYKSYFIAHVSSGLEPSVSFPADMKGKSFVFGSRISTSGRLIPEYWIRRQFKVPPKDVFSKVSFSGDHSSTLDLVHAGVADAGALDYTVFETAQREGKVDPSKVRVIWKSPPFPDLSFIIRGGVNEIFGDGFDERVKQVLLDLDDQEVLKAFGRPKLVAASNEQYEFIEELAKIVETEEREMAALHK
jgi:phosphonate transport system substrate-binding protein